MTARALTLARAGDEEAFRELTDPHRRELHVHCYRIVGSLQDAEDLVQETLLAAWRGLEQFDGRASLRAWLYRIATNRCLNALRDSARRPQQAVPQPVEMPAPTRWAEPVWLEPYPDALLEALPDSAPGPEARLRGAGGRSSSPSSSDCSTSRRASAPRSCFATCSGSGPRRSQACSRRARRR